MNKIIPPNDCEYEYEKVSPQEKPIVNSQQLDQRVIRSDFSKYVATILPLSKLI